MKRPWLALWLMMLGGTSACAGLLSLPDLAIALLFVTCGLGMPFFLTPALAAYLACLAPAMAARSRVVGGLGSVMAVLALALVPGALSQREAAAEVRRATALDTHVEGSVAPRSLQVERPANESYDRAGSFFGDEVCDDACRALLLGGEVDWLRVVTLHADRPGQALVERDRVRLVAAQGADCAEPEGDAVAEAVCVVFTPDDAVPAELALRVEEGSRSVDPPYPGAGWASPMGYRRVTVRAGEAADAPVLLRHTSLSLDTVFLPAIPYVELRGMSSGGFAWARSEQRHADLSFPELLHKLGYSLARLDTEQARPARKDWRDAPFSESTRQVVSILDLPPETAFSDAQNQVVVQWVVAARAWSGPGDWTAGRLDVLRRIVGDGRVRSAWALDQVVERNPVVVEAVLPLVIERIGAEGLTLHTPWVQALYGLGRVDPSLLVPHRDALAALVDAHAGSWEVLVLAGRLGRDPTPWLTPLTLAVDPDLLDARLRGVCRAETRWSAELVSPLRMLFDELDPAVRKHEDLAETVARAMARHGAAEEAAERLVRWGGDGPRAAQRLRSHLKRQGVAETICR